MAGTNTGPLGIPAGGPWFVFPFSGTIQRQSNPLLAIGLAKAGWLGFATQADAKAYASKQSVAAQTNSAVSSVGGAVTDTTNFLSRLADPAVWLRVAEVALGLVLIAVGVAKISSTAMPAATKLAKNAAKLGEVAALA